MIPFLWLQPDTQKPIAKNLMNTQGNDDWMEFSLAVPLNSKPTNFEPSKVSAQENAIGNNTFNYPFQAKLPSPIFNLEQYC